jgi:hypothetical protein
MTTPWHAIFSFHALLIGVAAVALVYGLFVRRLAELVQPLRLQLAERGEKYISISKDGKERRSIEFYLDNAFNPWICVWGSLFLPALTIWQLVRPMTPKFDATDKEEYRKISALFTISVFAANPLFGLIMIFELTIATIIIIIFSGKLNILLRVGLALVERQAVRRPARHHAPAQ